VKYLPENSSDGKKRRQSSKPEPPELLPFMVSYISCNINIQISKDVMDFSYKQKKVKSENAGWLATKVM
jgi:hypothetical protein